MKARRAPRSDNLLIPPPSQRGARAARPDEQRVAHEVLRLIAETKSAVFTVEARQQFRLRLSAILEVNEAGADPAQRQFDAGNVNRLERANLQLVAQQAKLELARTDAQFRRGVGRRLRG
jgi:hypothetical protein